MPTLTQLEYLVSVEKHRHFGKAAKACHVSQPTLSQQIQKLEDQLGIVVFDRVQKPVILTDQGEKVLEQAKIILREHQKLLHLSQQQKSRELSGELKLAIIPTVASDLVPLFVSRFAQRYPQVRLSLVELKTDTITHELEEDQIDAGILATPLPQTKFHVHPLYYEGLLLYLSPKHPLLEKKTVSSADLDPHGLWMLSDGHCFRNQVLNFCSFPRREQGALQNVAFESGSLETLRNLVRKNPGYTLLPELMVQRMSETEVKNHVRSFSKPIPTREISLIYRRDHWKLEILNAIEKVIQESIPQGIQLKKQSGQELLEIC